MSEEICNILIIKNNYNLDVKVIVTDTELSLIKSLKNNFLNTKRIACYFYYVHDKLRNIKVFELY